MVGTSPTFLKVLTTTELVQCVQRGEYPATPMVFLGMKLLDNRRIILQCYEAFKQFVV